MRLGALIVRKHVREGFSSVRLTVCRRKSVTVSRNAAQIVYIAAELTRNSVLVQFQVSAQPPRPRRLGGYIG